MISQHDIYIVGFKDPPKFVEQWSSLYVYPNERKYNNFIHRVFDDRESFFELFKWKNGTGDGISNDKTKVIDGFYDKIEVLRELRERFNWKLFEDEFQPSRNSSIWKIFLLHLINPSEFPIFDQHVYRFYIFQRFGLIEEITSNHRIIFDTYKQDYKPWFNSIQQEYQLNPKLMDQSFFVFGKVLKNLKGLPFLTTYK